MISSTLVRTGMPCPYSVDKHRKNKKANRALLELSWLIIRLPFWNPSNLPLVIIHNHCCYVKWFLYLQLIVVA